MTLIAWIVIFECIVGGLLLIWLVRKAFKHAKHSPAEIALKQHLVELEAAKQAKLEQQPAKEGTKPTSKKKSKRVTTQ